MEVMIMSTYEKLSRHPRHFLSFTGLRLEDFDKLYNKMEPDYEDFEKKGLDRKGRIRAIPCLPLKWRF
jgi:hypothetical protein